MGVVALDDRKSFSVLVSLTVPLPRLLSRCPWLCRQAFWQTARKDSCPKGWAQLPWTCGDSALAIVCEGGRRTKSKTRSPDSDCSQSSPSCPSLLSALLAQVMSMTPGLFLDAAVRLDCLSAGLLWARFFSASLILLIAQGRHLVLRACASVLPEASQSRLHPRSFFPEPGIRVDMRACQT